jgi:hypothetical protein
VDRIQEWFWNDSLDQDTPYYWQGTDQDSN